MTWQETYKEWQANDDLDERLREELGTLEKSPERLKEAFYAPLEFGTAGMRGLLGPGVNRMNSYTVRQATEGLALFVASLGEEAKVNGVVVAYDSRHYSPEFGLEAAKVLANHEIQVYLFSGLRPTPELSFAVRELHCAAGIMITASHNPAEYNGFKVYGSDGGQMPPADADRLTSLVRQVANPLEVGVVAHTNDRPSPFIKMIDDQVDSRYLAELTNVTLNTELIEKYGADLKLVYTPLHGAGAMLGEKALKQAGFTSYVIEPEQMIADGDFSTVKSPNPEEYSAFEYAIRLGKKEQVDLLVATDPDADRLGAAAKLPTGDYQVLSGNQIAALSINYLLTYKQQQAELTGREVVLKSIVSSELGTKICDKYNVEMVNVLTGFKFIAEKIETYEQSGTKNFLFGYEESYGYLVKSFVRDKDAIQTLVLLAEVAAYYQSREMTLYDGLIELFEEFGYFEEKTISVTMSGLEGAKAIQKLMADVRKNPITEFANVAVECTEDYEKQVRTKSEGLKEKIDLPPANVMKYWLADGSWIAIRPSGTEPKIKFYLGVQGLTSEQTNLKVQQFEQAIEELISNNQ